MEGRNPANNIICRKNDPKVIIDGRKQQKDYYMYLIVGSLFLF